MKSQKKFYIIIGIFLILSIITGCPGAKSSKKERSSPPKAITPYHTLKEPPVLRVATFNCEWLFDNDPSDQEGVPPQIKQLFPKTRKEYEAKLHGVAQVLIAVRAHVYALQEVEDADVLQDLANLLEYNLKRKYEVCFIKGEDRYTQQNVGILSSYPVLTVRRFQFHRGTRVTKHLSVTLDVAGEEVQIITLHLKAGSRKRNREKRVRQARAIHQQIQKYVSKRNMILLGDLNTHGKYKDLIRKRKGRISKDAEFYLTGKYTRTQKDDLIDIHMMLSDQDRITHGENHQFDRILLSPPMYEDDPHKEDLYFLQAGRWKVDRRVSDHHLLWVDFGKR